MYWLAVSKRLIEVTIFASGCEYSLYFYYPFRTRLRIVFPLYKRILDKTEKLQLWGLILVTSVDIESFSTNFSNKTKYFLNSQEGRNKYKFVPIIFSIKILHEGFLRKKNRSSEKKLFCPRCTCNKEMFCRYATIMVVKNLHKRKRFFFFSKKKIVSFRDKRLIWRENWIR